MECGEVGADWRTSERTERRKRSQSGGVEKAEDAEMADERSWCGIEETIWREWREWRSEGSRKIDGNIRDSYEGRERGSRV